ncbi:MULTISPECIES: hypothetical protein [unclassified Variovorax]|uniref:hypothetical protein n=1 Tax=unclassified Variovorax TaxID=663243 RepID=UPI0008ACB6DC|nr:MULTISPECIES: hypothetical protein [unclassified Variovorax]SEK17127.1 hypothetical protein SAMN05518853_13619 [Variovorax sp. OK202]SFE72986.1 catalase [Variovorax sp. OK212]
MQSSCPTAKRRLKPSTRTPALEFLRDQYWHCKTILAFGASDALLAEAQIPMTLPDGAVDPGLILADAASADEGIGAFIEAMGAHRHFGRENDTPKA